jgi:hypothetical protein
VPCPGLAVGFSVAKEQPAHTKHATAWETKGIKISCIFWNDLSFLNTYVFWLSSSLSRQETPNTV